MAGDHVAAQRIADLERPLEVDAAPRLEVPQRRQRERLRAEVGAEVPERALDDGQTNAVDGDARADRHRLDTQVADDDQAHERPLIQLNALDRLDDTQRFDDSREHGYLLQGI